MGRRGVTLGQILTIYSLFPALPFSSLLCPTQRRAQLIFLCSYGIAHGPIAWGRRGKREPQSIVRTGAFPLTSNLHALKRGTTFNFEKKITCNAERRSLYDRVGCFFKALRKEYIFAARRRENTFITFAGRDAQQKRQLTRQGGKVEQVL